MQDTKNSEQLAKAMMYFYPRANSKRNKNGKNIISNDFISISNGEAGQKSKKVQTTTLPKEITINMLVSEVITGILLMNVIQCLFAVVCQGCILQTVLKILYCFLCFPQIPLRCSRILWSIPL